MRRLTKEEILKSFQKNLRKKVKLLDLDSVDWENLDYLGWLHPSGHLGYMVYEFKNKLIGIVLETSPKVYSRGIRMCSLCYTLDFASRVKLFTINFPHLKKSIGNYICKELDCSLKVRKLKEINVAQMPETMSIEEKIKRLQKNLDNFFSQIERLMRENEKK